MNSCFAETAIRALPRLNRLNLSNLKISPTIQLLHLHHLTLGKSTIDELNRIFSQAPQLRSLNISLQGDISSIHHLSPCSQLNRLTLKIDDSRISIAQMERFLPKLTQLIHFELHVKGDHDLADGHRWKILSEGLLTFNFKFEFLSSLDELTLDSFRTEFWLREKHCASFTVKSSYSKDERHWYFDPEFSIRGTRRLIRGTFRCRFYRSTRASSSYDVHIWIEERVS
ncbi:unnamed protein product [Rotaria sordida]|uniref:Uncharacterized protein n=1 Tax=Rotaria sordida TaxID=392033 RepID=A0A819V2C4_9BILA|nr:unnamed protein product [Rotaria sordida]